MLLALYSGSFPNGGITEEEAKVYNSRLMCSDDTYKGVPFLPKELLEEVGDIFSLEGRALVAEWFESKAFIVIRNPLNSFEEAYARFVKSVMQRSYLSTKGGVLKRINRGEPHYMIISTLFKLRIVANIS